MKISINRSDLCRLIRLVTAASYCAASTEEIAMWIKLHDQLTDQLEGWDFHQLQKKEGG